MTKKKIKIADNASMTFEDPNKPEYSSVPSDSLDTSSEKETDAVFSGILNQSKSAAKPPEEKQSEQTIVEIDTSEELLFCKQQNITPNFGGNGDRITCDLRKNGKSVMPVFKRDTEAPSEYAIAFGYTKGRALKNAVSTYREANKKTINVGNIKNLPVPNNLMENFFKEAKDPEHLLFPPMTFEAGSINGSLSNTQHNLLLALDAYIVGLIKQSDASLRDKLRDLLEEEE